MPAQERQSRPFFWIGMAALAVGAGPIVLGFLAVISMGMILFPLLIFILGAPLFVVEYALWRKSSAPAGTNPPQARPLPPVWTLGPLCVLTIVWALAVLWLLS